MDWQTIIALGGLAVACITVLLTGRRDTRASASDQAQTMAKLDSIAGGVDDIRVEQRAMRERVDKQATELASLAASVKSAHHRIDGMEQRFNQVHPPN